MLSMTLALAHPVLQPSLEQWVPQWARAAEAAAVYRPTTEDQGALIFQSQGLPAVKPLVSDSAATYMTAETY